VKLQTFASAWTFGSFDACLQEVRAGHFDGVESPAPATTAACRELRARLGATPFIAEVCTGGDYAPSSNVPVERHVADFEVQCARGVEAGAQLVSCLAGSDSWPLSRSIDVLGRMLEKGAALGATLSFETHRGRPTFHPWATAELLRALPELWLTCDFSHWCVVTERLVDDESVLDPAIARARHVHARVGYAQGPQVPHPRAPEFARELDAHERWWARIWHAARERGDEAITMTPEFGPDGYLHHAPFTRTPVADLAEINRWMSARQRARFSAHG
jgi:hypothetical protein